MNFESSQRYFCDSTWNALEESASTTIVPVKGYRPPDGNMRQRRSSAERFLPAALSAFEAMPFADRYMERFKVPPMAMVRLGRCALFAVSFRTEGTGGKDLEAHTEERIYSHLISLEYDRMRELSQVNRGKPFSFGRRQMIGVSGGRYGHEDVSGKHVKVVTGASEVTIIDLGSLVGTMVAVENGAWENDQTPEHEEPWPMENLKTDDHLRLWEKEFAADVRGPGGLQVPGPA